MKLLNNNMDPLIVCYFEVPFIEDNLLYKIMVK